MTHHDELLSVVEGDDGPGPPVDAATVRRQFRALGETRYVFAIPDLQLELDVDRLRREKHTLVGELAVRCGLAGARTVNGNSLSVADFNLSSARARTERARQLDKLTAATELDWERLLEEFCQRVLTAEREGRPATMLREFSRPVDDHLDVDGVRLHRRHPVILFGDGGTAKSYTGLYLAGVLDQRGVRVLYADWEFAGEDHRDRLERLFGSEMPGIQYIRCERPMVYEADRIRRIVREDQIEYLFADSIAFACDGPPEAAEVAGAYFRAVRQIGVGSLHIAHVTKGENGDKKPFGSSFWHNGARSTWNVKPADQIPGHGELSIGLFNRKANIGPLRPAIGFRISFSDKRTTFKRVDLRDVQELAPQLPLWQRMSHELREGPQTIVQLADALGAKVDTIERTARRKDSVFTKVSSDDGVYRLALVERRVS
jgi:hypothetical protein